MRYRTVDVGDLDAVVPDPGPPPRLEMIPVDRILIDDTYQRPLGKASFRAIERIAQGFRWSKFQAVTVAPVGDCGFVLIDGQHRAHAAAVCGIAEIPAMVVSMDAGEQAAAFAAINGNVTRMSVFHVYKAALAAGEAWALECRDVVEGAGCRLMTYNKGKKDRRAREVFGIGLVRGYVRDGDARIVSVGLSAITAADEASDPELYANTVLAPWFSAISADKRFLRLDLAEFLRWHDLVGLLATADAVRRKPEYRGFTRHALIKATLTGKLETFAARTGKAA